jgi:hypothetical protein
MLQRRQDLQKALEGKPVKRESISELKKQLLTVLEPGETVSDALKRLSA